MTAQEIIAKVTELKELKIMAEELAAEISSLEDTLKADMLAKDVEEMTAGAFKLRYKTVISNRFDSSSFNKDPADVYAMYTKQTSSKRFTVTQAQYKRAGGNQAPARP